jgi:hypothetical protein
MNPNLIPPREKIIALTTGVPVTLDVSAQWVSCIGCAENFRLSINDGPDFSFFQGGMMSFPSADISKLVITSAPSAVISPQTITLLYGSGEFRDGRLSILGGIQIASGQTVRTTAETLSGANPDVALAALAAAVQIVAANTARRCVRVRNLDQSNSVRVASAQADATAGRGEFIEAGAAVEIFAKSALYAYSAAGASVAITEEVY